MNKAPTAKQIAARERFAKMARSGAFKRTRKSATKKARASNPRVRTTGESGEFFVNLPAGKHKTDAWIVKRNAKGGWLTSPDFSDAMPMSASQAANVKAYCDRVREPCVVMPVVAANPKRREEIIEKNPSPRARKVTHVELDSTGDHFGADQTTIQLWHLRAGETKRAYRSFRIPAEVVRNADFQAWARGMNYVLSMNYRQMLEKLRKFA